MKIFIIVGPSGSGKDTMGGILKQIGIPELVSHTTREIRVGEVDGVDYHFINKEDMPSIEMLETSNYAGNIYGLSRREVDSKLSEYSDVFAITDINGMEQIRRIYKDIVVPIFISVKLSDMIGRMISRGDKESDILDRIRHCKENKELDNGDKCKYIIENSSLEAAREKLLEIVKKENVNICA